MTFLHLVLAISVIGGARHRPEPTPIGRAELAAVLRDGHFAVFGTFPSKKRLGVAWAQAAIECGQGAKSKGHNIGNVGAVGSQGYYVVAGARYRNFDSFVDGAEGYWRAVAKHTRALQAFDVGDADAAARALAGTYYRAPASSYAAAMRSLYATFQHEVSPQL